MFRLHDLQVLVTDLGALGKCEYAVWGGGVDEED